MPFPKNAISRLTLEIHRLISRMFATSEPLDRVPNILVVLGFLLNAINNGLNENVAVFDSHRYSQRQQPFPPEWETDQLKNVLLGGNDQIRVAPCSVDSLPISQGVVVMILEFEHINDLALPVMNDPIKGLRICNRRHCNNFPSAQETQGVLLPTPGLKPYQSQWFNPTMKNQLMVGSGDYTLPLVLRIGNQHEVGPSERFPGLAKWTGRQNPTF